MSHLHLPLSEELSNRLRCAAQRTKQSSTTLAREAINLFLKDEEKKLLHQQIAAYATTYADTKEDIDKELEAASISALLSEKESQ